MNCNKIKIQKKQGTKILILILMKILNIVMLLKNSTEKIILKFVKMLVMMIILFHNYVNLTQI